MSSSLETEIGREREGGGRACESKMGPPCKAKFGARERPGF
jgi:hypothetical protein